MAYLFPTKILAALVLTSTTFKLLSRKSVFWKESVEDQEICHMHVNKRGLSLQLTMDLDSLIQPAAAVLLFMRSDTILLSVTSRA